MRWFEQRRMEWIEETLRVLGYINRKHLMQEFGVSATQVSHDFAEFQKFRPGLMEYDKSAKCYVARNKWITATRTSYYPEV